jgi:acyl phosphate:glycerol-3-phosphate acyltransferase
MWWALLVAALIGYLLGSLPMGLIAGKLVRGVDIRDYGSGKTGFTNALRTIGLKAALLVLLGDVVKGVAPVLIARVLSDDAYAQMVAGLAAIVGHDWPVFAGFRGGRGVTTYFGVLLAMNPLVMLALVPVGVGIAVVTRYMSVMSTASAVIAAAVLIGLAAADVLPAAYAIYSSLGAALIVVLHRENIARLLAGKEPKIGHGGEKRAEKVRNGRATSS